MKNKIKLVLASVYIAFLGLISPIWLGIIYIEIIGHGKGHGYDLGSEADIRIILGFISLILWIIALIPMTIWTSIKFRKINKKFVFIPTGLFFIFLIVTALVMVVYEFQRLGGT